MTKTFLIEIIVSSTDKNKKKEAISQLKGNGFKRMRKKDDSWYVIKTFELSNSKQQINELIRTLFNSIDNVSVHITAEINSNRS